MKSLHIYKNHSIKSVINFLHFENTLIFQSFSLEDDNKLTILIDNKPIFILQIENML